MTRIRTVNLELLRHGPPHNQLLSPLTRYLGLCGNYEASTVNVPYEHGELMSRLKMLRYQDPASRAARQQHDTRLTNETIALRNERTEQLAKKMAEMLETMPGLICELNAHPDNDTLTHLRLTLSYSELALLPFELSKVPAGCKGGHGNWLALQPHAPVCITRQIRGIEGDQHNWNRKPRILFAAAATRDMEALVQAHTTALTQAIRPWLHYFDKEHPGALEAEFDKHLTVLPNATLEAIEKACCTGDYSHVHILAHGALDDTRPGTRYGINLYSSPGSEGDSVFETVSGEKLAMALGALKAPCPGKKNPNAKCHPLVVTVASCDSGQQGDVVYDGASFAHDLHRFGIPFVVASQFPLSFAGSVRMAQVLYEKLICGLDPRLALHRLRTKLYALHDPGIHDWAAVVAYTALPNDLSSQLKEFRYQQARSAIEDSLSHVDAVTDRIISNDTNINLARLMEHVDDAVRRLPTEPDYATETKGLRGTVEKRKAEAYFRLAVQQREKKDQDESIHRCVEALQNARRHYLDAAQETLRATDQLSRKKRELHWPLTQYLTLSLVLDGRYEHDQWQVAQLSVEIELDSDNKETKTWAQWSQLELYLLQAATSPKETEDQAVGKLQALAVKLAQRADRTDFATYSSRRQLQRYVEWWSNTLFLNHPDLNGTAALGKAKSLAEKLLGMIPKSNMERE